MTDDRGGEPLKLTVYAPDDGSGGLWRTAALAAHEIARARPVIWRLFVRDFKAQYQQNILGYLWAFLSPLLGMFSFVFLNYAGILNPGDVQVPYPLYVFVGTSLWTLMVGAVATVSGGLRGHADLIMRTNISKIALVAASLATVVYALIVNLIVIAVLLVAFRTVPGWGALALPLLALPIVVFGIGLGLAVSVVGIIARDVGIMVTQVLNALMFLTPIVYLAHSVQQPVLRAIILANPLTYLVEVPRAALFGLPTDFWWPYLGACALSLLVLLVGIKIFYVVQDLVAERL